MVDLAGTGQEGENPNFSQNFHFFKKKDGISAKMSEIARKRTMP